MPQLTAISVLWLWIENRFLNGPASQLPASWNHLTISFDGFAENTINRIAITRMPTTTAVAARTTPASNIMSLPPCVEVGLPGRAEIPTGDGAARGRAGERPRDELAGEPVYDCG